MTTKLQKAFFNLVQGKDKKHQSWLTPVKASKVAKKPAKKK